MVVLYLLFLLFPFTMAAQEGNFSAAIEPGTHIQYQPLKGTVTITHDKSEEVNLKSFRLDGKPLAVELTREVPISTTSNLLISFYSFTVPGQEKGLHKLPEISATVGNQNYNSVPSTYEVGQLAVGTPSSNVVLNFENIVEGGEKIYPGQRISIGYRYMYSGTIDLTQENLPMLDAKGLLKVGAKSIKD
jgi:hypothetical protein